MNRGFLKYVLIITILVSPITYYLSQKYFLSKKIDEAKYLNEVFQDADYFSAKLSNPPHYKAYKKNEVIGVVFLTYDILPNEKGYSGTIKILVGMNKLGAITGIKILEHTETPSYAEGITAQWFTDQYKNLNFENSFEIGKDVDGISRATISVSAVNRIIKKSTRLLAQKNFGLAIPKEDEFVYLKFFINRDVPLIIGLFIIAIIAFKTKNKILRNISMILGIIYLGFTLENYFSIINVLNILFNKLPDFTSYFLWYILLIGILLTTFLWGKIYCFYICPFGGIQEFLYSFNRNKCAPPPEIDEKARLIKFVILWVIVIISSVTGNFFLTNYEPFTTLFGRTGTILSWLLVLFVLIASFIYNRFWCKYFCAVGVVLDFLSKFNMKKSRKLIKKI